MNNKKYFYWIGRIIRNRKGFTLIELIVTLSIFSLLVGSLSYLFIGKVGRKGYDAECEEILNIILESQNEAIMDGVRRQLRFFENEMYVSYTKDKVNYRRLVLVKTFKFTGTYIGGTALNLSPKGTISKAGTMNLNGFYGESRQIVFQLGSGRIYFNENK